MKILSFDVGIKNLAYCQLDTEDGNILDWGILNISVDPTCEHVIKGKCCECSAKKILKDNGLRLCSNHCKLKCYKDLKMKNTSKCENPMFELGKCIIKTLDSKNNLLESDIVIIENQPALKNPTMKSVQMIVYSYFLMNDGIKDIQMINARNKLKAYKGPAIPCDIKETYKRNKYLAIKYTDVMIRENDKIEEKYHKLFDNSKKKDDLSDSYLQGIYYISQLNN
jgi:hypothetical protein